MWKRLYLATFDNFIFNFITKSRISSIRTIIWCEWWKEIFNVECIRRNFRPFDINENILFLFLFLFDSDEEAYGCVSNCLSSFSFSIVICAFAVLSHIRNNNNVIRFVFFIEMFALFCVGSVYVALMRSCQYAHVWTTSEQKLKKRKNISSVHSTVFQIQI